MMAIQARFSDRMVNRLITARMAPSWRGLPGAVQLAAAALCAYLATIP